MFKSLDVNSSLLSQSTITADNFVLGFRQRDIDSSRLYYLNYIRDNIKNQTKKDINSIEEDSFSVNISIPTNTHNKKIIIGPFRIPIKLIDLNQVCL